MTDLKTELHRELNNFLLLKSSSSKEATALLNELMPIINKLIDKNNRKTIDPIIERVVKKIRSRSEVGIKKYGTTLEENNTDDFLKHLQEELMDAVNYIEKLRSKTEEAEAKAKE